MAGRTPGEVFVERLKEIRHVRGYTSQTALSDRLREVGLHLSPNAIARIETGERDVKLEEAIGIAAALNVAPLSLFLPLDEEAEIALTPEMVVDTGAARAWATGRRPLDVSTFQAIDGYIEQGLFPFADLNLYGTPEEVREALIDKWMSLFDRYGAWGSLKVRREEFRETTARMVFGVEDDGEGE